ncbi:MAG: SDR family NAD(P)-dependent oxidoreductase, partial [Pseudomonadales bacterium]|nr:SDR family NAD(P)-dependent oxidoreductase [Pseudomonadales bacterium]
MAKNTLLITGASRGIGLATAKRFQRAGYGVVNLSRSQPDLPGVEHIALDIADAEAIQAAAKPIANALSQVGNSAGSVVLVH